MVRVVIEFIRLVVGPAQLKDQLPGAFGIIPLHRQVFDRAIVRGAESDERGQRAVGAVPAAGFDQSFLVVAGAEAHVE